MNTQQDIENKKIVTRFAPSPTGFMHVGNVRTAIFAYLWAKKNNGTFILRIEDTDKAREVAGVVEHMKESLIWLGINWDEGDDVGGPHAPYTQSLRTDIYNTYAKRLIEAGYAYVDPYTEDEVEVARAEKEAAGMQFLYRDLRKKEAVPIPWTGLGQTLRFKVRDLKRTNWYDVVFGELSAGEEALDDFVLIKKDGLPTYNFCHIVDDIEMGVTHVMRGQEYVSSTPKYLALYEALGVQPPVFVSFPHILAEGGKKKLGKRDGAKDILEYKKEGYLSEAMFNFLAFLGFNPGGEQEVYSKKELIKVFDIDRIQRSGARLNNEKLEWFNREYIKQLTSEEFWNHTKPYIKDILSDTEEVRMVLPKLETLLREKIAKFSDIHTLFESGEFEYFFEAPNLDREILVWKQYKQDEDRHEKTRQILKGVQEVLVELTKESWSASSIKQALTPLAETHGNGAVFWPFRVALSGREKSPDPFLIAEILGKEKTIFYLDKVVK
jgi:glutamyl-tRNA synthetase